MNITNEGEDAYEAALYVHLPQHVSYIKTEMIGTNPSEMVSVLCSPPTLENDFVLKCDLGNPMMGFSKVSTYFLDVLWCQLSKLIQVVSTSEFH